MSRPRFAAAALAAFALATSGLTPAHASTPSDQAAAAQAAAQADQQQIEQLNAQIDQSNGQLKQLADQLAGLDKQLGDAEAKISALQAKLNDDQAQDDQLKAQLNQLARLSYEQQGAWLPQILGSDSLIHLWGNLATSHIVADQEQTLKLQIEVVAREDAATKKDLDATLSNLTVARAQAATLEEVTQEQADALKANRDQVYLQQQADLAAAARAAARNVIYQAVSGPGFTIDTDLRIDVSAHAASLNAYFTNTAFAGLGVAFINAGQREHVNAIYLVAHAIEESAFGTSGIAVAKNNLFGIGADDANPYLDAQTFGSYQDCIDYQAHFVATHYLDPKGPFFHGPTLRGMNVDYASDPNWATKIATIYSRVPAG